jgi:hypothetical protein
MATKTKAPTKGAPTVDADGYAIIDPTATKVDFDPKQKRPWKLKCVGCQKLIRRADRAPGHTCFKCDTAAKPASARTAKQVARADTAEAVNVAKVAKPSKSQNPRTAANKMVMDRAKAIAARSQVDA